MLWRLIVFLMAAWSVPAAILPVRFGPWNRSAGSMVTPSPADLWAEFGLNEAERATYSGAGQTVTVTAYRMKDPTGAFAAFQWQRPASAQSALTSATIPGGSLLVQDNYLLRFEGQVPHPSTLPDLYRQLPQVTRSSLPPLYSYLPVKNRVPNSERYLLGDKALARFAPGISEELAAFDRGAEAQVAHYRTSGSEFQLVLFSYPTPQIAIERARRFANLAGAIVRRTGPLLAVVPAADGNPAAHALVSDITYKPKLSWNEEVIRNTPQDAAKMILAIAMLALGLIVLATLLGVVFGGSRVLASRFGIQTAKEDFTTLHLDQK